jgi:hypothetical protein
LTLQLQLQRRDESIIWYLGYQCYQCHAQSARVFQKKSFKFLEDKMPKGLISGGTKWLTRMDFFHCSLLDFGLAWLAVKNRSEINEEPFLVVHFKSQIYATGSITDSKWSRLSLTL